MKFVISSSSLSSGLQDVSKIITIKNTIPILDDFLFTLKGKELTITACDMETTLKTTIEVDESYEDGELAIPAKLLTDALKEFPDQPLEFTADFPNNKIEIKWLTGYSTLPIMDSAEYPQLPKLDEDAQVAEISAYCIYEGINRTQYAAATNDIRPVMSAIYFDFEPDKSFIVATDAHKLAIYTNHSTKTGKKFSFIVPRKPAATLKNLFSKEDETIVKVSFDSRNAYFEYKNTLLASRLIEGTYPAYRSIIPKRNNNHLIVNRAELLQTIKRITVCSNQNNGLIKLDLTYNQLNVSAEDRDYSLAANEDLRCKYEGDPLLIGFKPNYLIELLSNMPYEEVCIQLFDSTQPAVFVAAYPNETPDEEIQVILLPNVINN